MNPPDRAGGQTAMGKIEWDARCLTLHHARATRSEISGDESGASTAMHNRPPAEANERYRFRFIQHRRRGITALREQHRD